MSLTVFAPIPDSFRKWYASGLLPSPFRAEIVSYARFEMACQDGFYIYFDELIDVVEEKEVFVKVGYTWEEIVTYLMDGVSRDSESPFPYVIPLEWIAGFYSGWLSALACGIRHWGTTRHRPLRGSLLRCAYLRLFPGYPGRDLNLECGVWKRVDRRA
jgi:hypothetical protein